ncbi:MAG TPA: hypothetical protein VHC20_02580 [Candidatus Paceibacterota bacterium]|nr:hypothetical protein [Candidatus Paceibacterota bacterium]
MRPNQTERVEPGHKITLTVHDEGNKHGRDGQKLEHIVSTNDHTREFIGMTIGEKRTLSNNSDEAGMHECPVTLTEIALP